MSILLKMCIVPPLMKKRYLFIGLLALFLVGGIGFFLLEFPDTSLLKTHYPVIFTKGFQKPKVFFVKNRPLQWVSLNDVSEKTLGAVLVSEDWAFYHHKGLDPNQIKKAFEINWKKGRFVRGASTITQQVVRNVFLTKDKNLWRKFKEIILALSPVKLGEFTAGFIEKVFEPFSKPASPAGGSQKLKISRLARGLATGTDLEYADETTLKQAIDNRK